ncbi:MAG TPA: molybdopterin biosynthesis protein [Syntrophomonadaceae bacterium]|nr:molybdopterin biosynthesis protein [Syntrophomonadaceae bacterium]
MKRKIYIENHPMDEARENFFHRVQETGFSSAAVEKVRVLEAYGRISSGPVFARRSSPHYSASAMDGIAVKARETELANDLSPITLGPDQFLEVDTGDYVPRQFDAVIMIEDVNFIDNCVRIIKPAVPWQHVRSVGEDLVAHDMIIPGAYPLGPYEVASFITAGLETVSVIKRPVVAIIPTGSELVEKAEENMQPGQIVESNSHMLAGLCQQWGAEVIRHPIVPDDRELLKTALAEMIPGADLIVMCSGSSAGSEDYTAGLLEEMGELLVHGLAIRPGKPAILGIIADKPFIGVPGYPISAQLVFTLFAKPLLYQKQGLPVPQPREVEACISRKTASHMGVDEFVYVNLARIKDRCIAYPLNRGAGITTSLVKADGVVLLPRGQEGLMAGETCQVTMLHEDLLQDTLVAIGSHDPSIDFLADQLRRTRRIRLVSTNVGSMGGLVALARQEAHLAGIHLLDPESGEYNLSYLNRYLSQQPWLLVNLAYREQGLMVKKGNPLGIRGLDDLFREEVRFINRQKGSGTRILFDCLLSQQNRSSSDINGYTREEYTHLAVAASVKNDACDAGLGIYASARAMDLDYIPIAEETYDICLLPDLMDEKQLDALIETIKSPEFRNNLCRAGGYRLDESGQIRASHA